MLVGPHIKLMIIITRHVEYMIGTVHDKLQTNLNSIQQNNFNITTSNSCMFFDSPRAKILKFIGSENPTVGVKEFELIVILVW